LVPLPIRRWTGWGRKVTIYDIRVKGHFDGRWSEWFHGLAITNLANGEALLSGDIVDQAALHGLLVGGPTWASLW
jgi:hypothetical protein